MFSKIFHILKGQRLSLKPEDEDKGREEKFCKNPALLSIKFFGACRIRVSKHRRIAASCIVNCKDVLDLLLEMKFK